MMMALNLHTTAIRQRAIDCREEIRIGCFMSAWGPELRLVLETQVMRLDEQMWRRHGRRWWGEIR